MLREKRQSNNNSSNYRISAAKPLIHSKHTSNRSISVAHTGMAKKQFITSINHNSTLTASKNLSIDRIYANSQKQYFSGEFYRQELYGFKKKIQPMRSQISSGNKIKKAINTIDSLIQDFIDVCWISCNFMTVLQINNCFLKIFKPTVMYVLQNIKKSGINLWQVVPPTFVLNSKDQVNMQHLDKFFDYYEKYLPKHIKNAHGDFQKEMFNYRKKLKSYFFNCNLKKILPKMPKLNQQFIDQDGEYLWIVKPTFLNRGRGIKVFSKLQTLCKYIEQNVEGYIQQPINKDKHQEDESPSKYKVDYIKRNSELIKQSLLSRDPVNRQVRQKRDPQYFDGNQYIRIQPKCPSLIKTDKFLIQKYLERPLLIMNRKFDMRIWVLISHNLKFYVFKQGYIRLSSMQYSVKDDQNNTFRHLTNNAIQKFSGDYGEIAEGNQLPYSKLRQIMAENSLNFDESLSKIYSHITLTLKSVWKYLNPNNRKFQFQIYGYDFMIDKTGHPWLIEVNNNPCIEESSTILMHYLPRMLNDAFKLTLDQLFWGSVSNGKFPVQGYKDEENMWLRLDVEGNNNSEITKNKT